MSIQDTPNSITSNNLVEITDNPETARMLVQELYKALRGKDGKPKSRAVALAVTKLQEAAFWLGEAMFSEG